MKKGIILISLLLLLTPVAFALGRNDGSSKAHSIEFDWENGHVQEPGAFWYRVALAPVFAMQDPELYLTLTNLSTDTASLILHATISGDLVEIEYKIAGGGSRTREMDTNLFAPHEEYIFLTLTSDKKVSLSADLTDRATSDVISPSVDSKADSYLVRGKDGIVYIQCGAERYSLTGARLQ